MSTRISKAEKELTQRIARLENRWNEEEGEANKAVARADLTRGVISELKDALSALRDEKATRTKKVRAEAQTTENKET